MTLLIDMVTLTVKFHMASPFNEEQWQLMAGERETVYFKDKLPCTLFNSKWSNLNICHMFLRTMFIVSYIFVFAYVGVIIVIIMKHKP